MRNLKSEKSELLTRKRKREIRNVNGSWMWIKKTYTCEPLSSLHSYMSVTRSSSSTRLYFIYFNKINMGNMTPDTIHVTQQPWNHQKLLWPRSPPIEFPIFFLAFSHAFVAKLRKIPLKWQELWTMSTFFKYFSCYVHEFRTLSKNNS